MSRGGRPSERAKREASSASLRPEEVQRIRVEALRFSEERAAFKKKLESGGQPQIAAQSSLTALNSMLLRLSRMDDRMNALTDLAASGGTLPADFANRLDLWRRQNAKASDQIRRVRTQLRMPPGL